MLQLRFANIDLEKVDLDNERDEFEKRLLNEKETRNKFIDLYIKKSEKTWLSQNRSKIQM